jgi:hypothetical protein
MKCRILSFSQNFWKKWEDSVMMLASTQDA